MKSTWTRLNSQLSLIKNCLGFRWCKDPRWPHSQLWLQLGSASPPSLLILKVFPPCSLFAGVHRFSPPPKQEVGRSITPLNIQTPCAPSPLHRGHRCPQQQQNSSKGLGEAENSSNKSTQQPKRPGGKGRGARRAQGGCVFRSSLQELSAALPQLLQARVCTCVPGKSILPGGRKKQTKSTSNYSLQVRGRKEFRGMNLEDPETRRGKVARTGDSAC